MFLVCWSSTSQDMCWEAAYPHCHCVAKLSNKLALTIKTPKGMLVLKLYSIMCRIKIIKKGPKALICSFQNNLLRCVSISLSKSQPSSVAHFHAQINKQKHDYPKNFAGINFKPLIKFTTPFCLRKWTCIILWFSFTILMKYICLDNSKKDIWHNR